MHILVVDDESLARQRLVRLINELPGVNVAGEASNGRQALERVEALDPDVIMLDIEMPGDDGITVAHKLNQLDDPPAIVFCTAYDEYALQAFETLAIGYLLKPVQLSQLQDVITKAQKVNKVQRSSALAASQELLDNEHLRTHISVTTRKGIDRIDVNTIYCFIADQKYVTIQHTKGETLTDETLKELEQTLDGRFIRTHRNALVAIQHIDALERTHTGIFQVRLKNHNYRPQISRRHLSAVKALLQR